MMASLMRLLSYAVPAVQATAEAARTVKDNQENSSQARELRLQYKHLLQEREGILNQIETIKSEVAAEREYLRAVRQQNMRLIRKIHVLETILAVAVMSAVGLMIAFFSGYLVH